LPFKLLFLKRKLPANDREICALKEEPTEKEDDCNFDAPMAAIQTLATVGSARIVITEGYPGGTQYALVRH